MDDVEKPKMSTGKQDHLFIISAKCAHYQINLQQYHSHTDPKKTNRPSHCKSVKEHAEKEADYILKYRQERIFFLLLFFPK